MCGTGISFHDIPSQKWNHFDICTNKQRTTRLLFYSVSIPSDQFQYSIFNPINPIPRAVDIGIEPRLAFKEVIAGPALERVISRFGAKQVTVSATRDA
jgi:hypothetical protein